MREPVNGSLHGPGHLPGLVMSQGPCELGWSPGGAYSFRVLCVSVTALVILRTVREKERLAGG